MPPPLGSLARASRAPAIDATTCAHTRRPALPAAHDPGTGPAVDVISVRATLAMGEPDGGAPPTGFDLDGVCTCPAPDSCTNSFTTKPHCDGNGGGDNSGG